MVLLCSFGFLLVLLSMFIVNADVAITEPTPHNIAAKEREWTEPRANREKWTNILRKAEEEYAHPTSDVEIDSSVIRSILEGDMSALAKVIIYNSPYFLTHNNNC